MNLLELQMPWWRKSWNENPLKVIVIIAIVLRILAAFFSKGYAFHDDHFDVIRVAQDWVDGIPHWIASTVPPKHSMFYAGINAIFLQLSEWVGITDPQYKMVVVRLIHAAYSMLIVIYGFKITKKLSNKTNATLVAMMLALLWFMPFLGVKNLVEMVCIPPVMVAFYIIIKDKVKHTDWLLAGLLFGLAFSLRYHTIIFAGGIGIVILFRKQFVGAVVFTVGFIISAFLFIGVIDMVFWEYPFQSIVTYFQYNTENAYNYSTGPIYRFLLTVVGFVVVPVSLFLLWGYIKSWKVSKEMWVAASLFFIIHSLFPNKQERFIIPFFPFFIILGVIGWNNFVSNSLFWNKKHGLLKGSWNFFWFLNIIAAIALALTYSKKDRIEPFTYLSEIEDVKGVIIESSSNSIKLAPEYYLGHVAAMYGDLDADYAGMKSFIKDNKQAKEEIIVVYQKPAWKLTKDIKNEFSEAEHKPNYIIFKRKDNLSQRLDSIQLIFPEKRLIKIKEIEPSYFDKLLHLLNPRVHKDEVSIIYQLEVN